MIRRFYVTNDSYPELRNIPVGLARSVLWWRAFGHAFRTRSFWIFVIAQLGVFAIGAAVLLPLFFHFSLGGAVAAVALANIAVMILLVTWGGDMMRPILRAVSDSARDSCPGCGHNLRGQLSETDEDVRCPECGEALPRSTFCEPYPIPRKFRAWGRARDGDRDGSRSRSTRN